MSLSNKILVFVVLSIAATLGCALWSIDRQLSSGLARVERKQAASEVAEACALVRHLAKDYGERAAGWSDSDELSRFLRDGNQAFLDRRVNPAALAGELHADVLVIAREEGLPVFAAQSNAEGSALETCSPDFLEHVTPRGLTRPGAPFTGLLALEGHTYLVSSRPIRTSKGLDGPVRGRLVTAQELDREWLQGLREFGALELELSRASDEAQGAEALAAREALRKGAGSFVAESSEQQLSGYGLLPDIYGQPALELRLVRERSVHAAGRELLGGILWTLVGGGVALCLLGYWATRRALVQPVQRLLACTRRLWAGERSHVVFKGGDELAALARDINRMTDAVFECEEALQNAMRDPAAEPPSALPANPRETARR